LALIKHVIDNNIFEINFGIIEVSETEYSLLFGDLKDFFTKKNRTVALMPNGNFRKITENSKEDHLHENDYKFIDIFVLDQFEKSGWYHKLPEL
jgi:hypothetical protein